VTLLRIEDRTYRKSYASDVQPLVSERSASVSGSLGEVEMWREEIGAQKIVQADIRCLVYFYKRPI
jgi:hypothetical protein